MRESIRAVNTVCSCLGGKPWLFNFFNRHIRWEQTVNTKFTWSSKPSLSLKKTPMSLTTCSWTIPSSAQGISNLVGCGLWKTNSFVLVILMHIFTALHAMQTQSSDENSVGLSVCPTVCLSIKRVNCNKTEEKSVQIFTPYERPFSPLLWEKEWLVGVDHFYMKFWVNRPPLERNRRSWTDNR